MKNVIAALVFCALAAGASAEEFTIRPSVWGTQKWPGGYNIYNAYGMKVGEVKASVWGQNTWVGGYKIVANDYLTTRQQRENLRSLLQTLR